MVESSSAVWWLRAHWRFDGYEVIGDLVVESSSVVCELKAH